MWANTGGGTNWAWSDFGGSKCSGYDYSTNYIVAGRDVFNNGTAKPGYISYTYPHPLIGGSITITGNYTTTFPLTENPISESGSWINGKTVGLDWNDVRTTSGFAYGTESGSVNYDDSTAILAGTWGPNQTVQATVHIVSSDSASFEEIELRLHTSITAHSITGYECNFSVKSGNQYAQIVRWNGPLGDFTLLDSRGYYAKNGDVVKATITSGGVITTYLNGTPLFSVTDTTYSGGSPGMGFYLQGGPSSDDPNFGFSAYSATDGSSAPVITTQPASLTNLIGSQFNFSVTASGATSYQWSYAGTNVTGATSSSWTVTPTVAQTNNVYVGVTNAYGGLASSTVHLVATNAPWTNTGPPAPPAWIKPRL